MAEGFRGILPFVGVNGAYVRIDLFGAGGTTPVGSLGLAAPAGTLLLPGYLKGFTSFSPFLRVIGDQPAFTLDLPGDVPRANALGKASPAGTISFLGVMGFQSPIFKTLGLSGSFLLGYDLGGVTVGALGLAGLTGETIEPLELDLDLPLEVFAKAKSAVVGSIDQSGTGLGFVLTGAGGLTPLSALAKGLPASNLNGIRYGYVIPNSNWSVDALGKSTILSGSIFQPIIINLGNLSVGAKGMAMPTSFGVGQPAADDFSALESGAYGMPTTVNIWNMALSHIGSKHFVESESERSREVSVLRIHWAAAVNKVLADRPWRFATKYARLGLITEEPNADWNYAYRYPADCVFARRLVTETGGRRDPDPPPFSIGQDSWGRIIYTDQSNAVLEYTLRVFETERYDPQFVTMLSWYLASLIAPPLSRVQNMAMTAFTMYKAMLESAASTALNEHQQDDPQEAEWILART